MVSRIAIACCAALVLASWQTRADALDDANALYREGNLPGAIAAYKRAAVAGLNPSLSHFNCANACFQLDSIAQAIVYYRACLATAPSFFRAHLNLAVAFYTIEDMGAAIASAREAVRLNPADKKAGLILAAAYRRTGSIAESVAMFEQLNQAFPEMEEPYIALAEMYRDLGDLEEAAGWLDRYPQIGKDLAYVFALSAEMYESLGDLARALYQYQQAFAADNSKSWLLVRVVGIQERLGNDLVAYEQARDGMRQFPQSAELAILAGNIAFRRERLEEAEQCYVVAGRLGNPAGAIGAENVRVARKARAESQ